MSKDNKNIPPKVKQEIVKQIKKSQDGVAVGSAPVPTFELAPLKQSKPKKKK